MSDLLSILLLNSDADTAELLKNVPDIQLSMASSLAEGWQETLQKFAPDILIADVSPKGDYATTLTRIERVRSDNPDLCIFVTSSSKAPELIISAMRAGAQEFLSKPINEHELSQAIERCRKRKEAALGRRHSGKLISVFSKSGGVGVTTLAVNLGVAFAQSSAKRAALVDLNLQHGDAASLLDLVPRYSIVDACESGDYVDGDKLQSCMTAHSSGLSILSEPQHPAASDDVSALQVQAILQHLRANFPYVVVDTPHIFEPRVMAAMDMSDLILLTTVATIPAIRSTKKVLALFHELGYAPHKVRLVVNRVSRVDRISVKEMADALSFNSFWTVPNNYTATSDALNAGKPLITQKRPNNVAKAILDMAQAMTSSNGNGHHA